MNNEFSPTPSRFATVHGSPGQNPRTRGPLRVFWPLAPICLAAGYLLRAALPIPNLPTTLSGFLLLSLAVVLALFIRWSSRRLRSFLRGAEGEEKVARVLSFLPAGHTVFNDLYLKENGLDVDHVVIAPSGLFVIETKTWNGEITFENGQVLCDGQPPSRSPLKQVKEAASRLNTYLSEARCPEAPVHPVLCFVDNRLKEGLANIGGVRICTDTNLHDLFENSLETPLEAGSLAIIAGELARSTESE